MSLSLVFYILVWIAIITLFVLMVISVQFCGMKEILFLRIANRADKIALTIISIIVCTIASIAFDYRAERALKNRIKMTLAIYEAEMDKIKDLEK